MILDAHTMNPSVQPARFNVEEWLKSIDIWDKKYDYVMHNEHWLSSKWEPDCKMCQAAGTGPPPPPPLKAAPLNNKTNHVAFTNTITTTTTTAFNPNNYTNATSTGPSGIKQDKRKTESITSAIDATAATSNNITLDKNPAVALQLESTTKATAAAEPVPMESIASVPLPRAASETFDTPAANNNVTTSSPVRSRLSMNSTLNDPTLKNDRTIDKPHNMDISPPPAGPPPVTIPMTPIMPSNLSTMNFVTPATNTKLTGLAAGNGTFQRSTRQTAKRLAASQAAHQDLIDLNETFDLYRSALADTPQLASHQTPGRNQTKMLPELNPRQEQQQQQHNQYQQQSHQQQQQPQQQQPGGSSRIPKIPVRLSNVFGFNH